MGPPGVEKDSRVKFLGPVKLFLGGEMLFGCLEKRVAGIFSSGEGWFLGLFSAI